MKLDVIVPCFNEEGNLLLFNETLKKELVNIDYQVIEYIFANYFRLGFSCQDENFLAIAIDVELAGANHGCERSVVLHGLPDGIIHAIGLKEFSLQMRAHIRPQVCCYDTGNFGC